MIYNPFGNLFFMRGYWLKWTDNIHILEGNISTLILSTFAIPFNSDDYRQTAQTLYVWWFCGSFSIWKPGQGKHHPVFSWVVFIYNTREKVKLFCSFYSWVSKCYLHLSVHLSSNLIHVQGPGSVYISVTQAISWHWVVSGKLDSAEDGWTTTKIFN